MTPQACEDIDRISGDELALDKRRSSFILRNKFRRLSGDKRLGLLWIVLEPLIMSLVYLFVLTVLRSSLRPESIFIGITLWGLVTVSIMSGLGSIDDFTGGLKCERVRTGVLVKPMIQFRIIDSLSRTSGVALILLFYFGIPTLGIISFFIIAVVLGFLCEGLALNMSRLTHAVPDLKIVTRYFLRLMFFAGPILYPLTMAEGIHYQANLYNPFAYFVELTRDLSGLENGFSNLDSMTATLVTVIISILAVRGYSQIDKLRWELSSWS